MGHIVRRGTPEAAPREPLPTTKISELRLDELVRETRDGDALADGTPIEISTIAMPRLERPDRGQITLLRAHDSSGPTRQMLAEPEPEVATIATPAALMPISRYPEAPIAGVALPRVLMVVLVLAIAWLGASLIYAVR